MKVVIALVLAAAISPAMAAERRPASDWWRRYESTVAAVLPALKTLDERQLRLQAVELHRLSGDAGQWPQSERWLPARITCAQAAAGMAAFVDDVLGGRGTDLEGSLKSGQVASLECKAAVSRI